MKKFKTPNVMVLLFIIIIIAAICTYIVPAGEYDRVEKDGKEIVDPESYHMVKQNPVNPFGMLKAIHVGMVESANIAYFILIIGGVYGVLQETGAIFSGISSVARKLQGRGRFAIIALMVLFALGGSIFGMSDEIPVFIPITVSLALALGFDSITGAAIAIVGAGAGFTGAFMNPFTIGVAQGVADLPTFSGMELRMILWLVFTAITTIYVYRYAGKIKEDPELSSVYKEDKNRKKEADFSKFDKITTSHKMVLLIVMGLFIILIYGVTQLDWYITELSALFLAMGLLSGLAAKMGINDIADAFVDGAKELIFPIILIGLSRGILVILTEGRVIDTILHGMAVSIQGLPPYLSAVGMYIFQCILNILVPSGSGQAVLTMPIMAPLGDLVGVTRQTSVLAYQIGDGLTNNWTPTSAALMASLGVAGIDWKKWTKWFTPLMIIWFIFGAVFVIIAQLIGYGPF